jgi:hypothetical protein
MPFIRLNDGTVAHIRMSKRPTKYCTCGKTATRLCDFKPEGAKRRCSAGICDEHVHVRNGLDYCPKCETKAHEQPLNGELQLG